MALHTTIRRSCCAAALLLALAACSGSGGGEANGPTASISPEPAAESSTTTTTEALTPEQEVEAAYLKSWDVYTKAKRELSVAGLDCCYAGEQLIRTIADIQGRIDTNRPARVVVDHDYEIRLLGADVAVVRDSYRNHSVLLDPKTGEPIESAPDDRYVDTSTLQKVDGIWKVTDSIRESGPSSP
jgi:hypothetical protein